MAYTDLPETNNNPKLRFEIIGEAWQKLSANMAPWVLASLVVILIVGSVAGPYFASVFLSAFNSASAGKEPPQSFEIGTQIISRIVATGISIINFVFLGGMVNMGLKVLRGQAISVGDVFSGFSRFGPLALAGLLYGLGVNIGFLFCVVPGLLLAGLWMLTVPLIMDQDMDAMTALKTSLNTLQPQMWMALGVYFVLSLVASLGSFACGIGGIVTYGLLPIGITLVYKDFFPERFPKVQPVQQDF